LNSNQTGHVLSDPAIMLMSRRVGLAMNKSEKIRALARQGIATADIARRLGIRYQHAYNVLKAGTEDSGQPSKAKRSSQIIPSPSKRQLTTDELVGSGFELSAKWRLSSSGDISLDGALPKATGVYAFAKGGIVMYVGLATMGLSKRLYFYGKPGVTQATSQRLNKIIRDELLTASCIEVYTAVPPNLEWNNLPIHGSAGLEMGLIKTYQLPWNMRGTGS
jgi:hypothetical protein